MRPEEKVITKRPDKFKRWMIASFILIPLVLFGSIGAYYAYFPVKMVVFVRLLAWDKTEQWARKQIFQVGDKAIPYLMGGFSSGNDRVRSRSSSVLLTCFNPNRRFDLEKVVPYLVKGLRSKNPNVRRYSVRAFYSLRTRATFYCGQWISDEYVQTLFQERTAHLLRVVRENKAIPELVIKLLSDPEESVRSSAAEALGWLGEKEAGPELIKALYDQSPRVRAQAARALERLGEKQAVPDLIKVLSDTDARVRSNAARALRVLGAKEAAPHLMKLLSDPDGWVRLCAAVALGSFQAKEAIPQLLIMLSDAHADARRGAASALGKFQEERAVPGLIILLSDPDDKVRSSAAQALGKIAPAEAVGPLIVCLEELTMYPARHWLASHIQDNVIEALEKITGLSFGDIAYAGTEAERQQIIQKWLGWWQENKEKYQQPDSEEPDS